MQATTRISVTLPVAIARVAKRLATRESRSVSAVISDALAKYEQSKEVPEAELTSERIMEIFAEAKANPWTPEQFAAERKKLARAAARRNKRLGMEIEPSDEEIVRIIHEFRAENRAQSRSCEDSPS